MNVVAWLLASLLAVDFSSRVALAAEPVPGAAGLFAVADSDHVQWPTSTADGILGLNEETVMVDAIVGGGLVTVHRFTDARSVPQLLAHVAAQWQAEYAPVMRAAVEGWQTLTRLDGKGIESIEIRAHAMGVEGRRIRWRRGTSADREAERSAQWLANILPVGNRGGPPVTHRDAGRLTTTVVVLTELDLADAVDQVRANLARAGYRETHPAPTHSSKGIAMMSTKGTDEIAVTVNEQGERRAVVIHWGRRG